MMAEAGAGMMVSDIFVKSGPANNLLIGLFLIVWNRGNILERDILVAFTDLFLLYHYVFHAITTYTILDQRHSESGPGPGVGKS